MKNQREGYSVVKRRNIGSVILRTFDEKLVRERERENISDFAVKKLLNYNILS